MKSNFHSIDHTWNSELNISVLNTCTVNPGLGTVEYPYDYIWSYLCYINILAEVV